MGCGCKQRREWIAKQMQIARERYLQMVEKRAEAQRKIKSGTPQ